MNKVELVSGIDPRRDCVQYRKFSFADAEWRLLMHLEHTPGLQALAKRLKEKLARREVDAHEEEAALQEALVNNRLKCLQVKIIEVALEELLHGHLRTSDRSSEREKVCL